MSDLPAETSEEAGAGAGTGRDPRWWLPWAGLVVGVWATLPKYSGPTLVTAPSREVVDHVVPGLLVLAASVACLWRRGRRQGPSLVPFVCGTLVLLAGFWMVATHVPLIVQATHGDAPWDATIYHSSAAFAVFGLGLMWVTVHWSDLAAIEAAQPRASKADPAG